MKVGIAYDGVTWDAAYVGSEELLKERGYTIHIRPRGEEKKELERNPNFKARRRVVEVTHSFMNRFRKCWFAMRRKRKIPLLLWSLPAPLSFGEN